MGRPNPLTRSRPVQAICRLGRFVNVGRATLISIETGILFNVAPSFKTCRITQTGHASNNRLHQPADIGSRGKSQRRLISSLSGNIGGQIRIPLNCKAIQIDVRIPRSSPTSCVANLRLMTSASICIRQLLEISISFQYHHHIRSYVPGKSCSRKFPCFRPSCKHRRWRSRHLM